MRDASAHEQIISSGIVPANGWLVVNAQGSFSLNNSGAETVEIYDQSSVLINSFQYNNSTEGKSWGRYPDGGPIASQVLNYTSGSANQQPSTPTPIPTPTPSPTPTASPSPTPTKSPTPKPTIKPTNSPSPSPEVLGEETSAPTESPVPSEEPTLEEKKPFPVIAVVMIVLGTLSIGAAFFPFLKKKLKGYNDSNAQNT